MRALSYAVLLVIIPRDEIVETVGTTSGLSYIHKPFTSVFSGLFINIWLSGAFVHIHKTLLLK